MSHALKKLDEIIHVHAGNLFGAVKCMHRRYTLPIPPRDKKSLLYHSHEVFFSYLRSVQHDTYGKLPLEEMRMVLDQHNPLDVFMSDLLPCYKQCSIGLVLEGSKPFKRGYHSSVNSDDISEVFGQYFDEQVKNIRSYDRILHWDRFARRALDGKGALRAITSSLVGGVGMILHAPMIPLLVVGAYVKGGFHKRKSKLLQAQAQKLLTAGDTQ